MRKSKNSYTVLGLGLMLGLKNEDDKKLVCISVVKISHKWGYTVSAILDDRELSSRDFEINQSPQASRCKRNMEIFWGSLGYTINR